MERKKECIQRAIVAMLVTALLFTTMLVPVTSVNAEDAKQHTSAIREIEWNIQSMHAEKAYADSQSAKTIKVAVLDSGLDYVEDIPFVERKDFLGEPENVMFQDMNGHGTAVTSLICALKNEEGITGVAANVDIYSARVLDENNQSTVERLIKAIQWAREKDVNIIHLSCGMKTYNSRLRNVIREAYKDGILIIAAAGNDGQAADGESTVEYPAAFPEVLAVGATDTANVLTTTSATGEIDLVAPGDQILCQGSFGGSIVQDGTSLSAAQVTGIAAALWGRDPSKSNAYISGLLCGSARKLGTTGEKPKYGAGLVDYEEAKRQASSFATAYEAAKSSGKTEKEAAMQAASELPDNNKALEEHREVNYVNGSWTGKTHEGYVEKLGAKFGTLNERHISMIRLGISATDRYSETKKYYHGGNNYVETTEYLYQEAIKWRSKKPEELKKIKTRKKGTNAKVKDIRSSWKKEKYIILSNFFLEWNIKHKKKTDYSKLTNTDCAAFILGICLHNATDTFAHRSYVKVSGSQMDRKTKSKWCEILHDMYRSDDALVKHPYSPSQAAVKLLGAKIEKSKRRYIKEAKVGFSEKRLKTYWSISGADDSKRVSDRYCASQTITNDIVSRYCKGKSIKDSFLKALKTRILVKKTGKRREVNFLLEDILKNEKKTYRSLTNSAIKGYNHFNKDEYNIKPQTSGFSLKRGRVKCHVSTPSQYKPYSIGYWVLYYTYKYSVSKVKNKYVGKWTKVIGGCITCRSGKFDFSLKKDMSGEFSFRISSYLGESRRVNKQLPAKVKYNKSKKYIKGAEKVGNKIKLGKVKGCDGWQEKKGKGTVYLAGQTYIVHHPGLQVLYPHKKK